MGHEATWFMALLLRGHELPTSSDNLARLQKVEDESVQFSWLMYEMSVGSMSGLFHQCLHEHHRLFRPRMLNAFLGWSQGQRLYGPYQTVFES